MAKVGRPKKTPDQLPKDWRAQIQALYADGATDTEVRVWIGTQLGGSFATDTFYRWLEEYPEFLETVNWGREAAKSWWEKCARAQAMGSGGNATTLIFMMRNRWGDEYKDVRQVESTVRHSVTGNDGADADRALQLADSRIIEMVRIGEAEYASETVQD